MMTQPTEPRSGIIRSVVFPRILASSGLLQFGVVNMFVITMQFPQFLLPFPSFPPFSSTPPVQATQVVVGPTGLVGPAVPAPTGTGTVRPGLTWASRCCPKAKISARVFLPSCFRQNPGTPGR